MKRTTQDRSDKWFGIIFGDTIDTVPPHDGAPPPVPEFGIEPPIHRQTGRTKKS